ncbi:MAG: C40 family peptidase [Patescibacteria group bacterium]
MYRAVGRKIAIDFQQIQTPQSAEQITGKLKNLGFIEIPFDPVGLAQSLIGKPYKLGALLAEAPQKFDCSGFVKYIYGQFGIWIHRYTIYQKEHGQDLPLKYVRAGDLVFKAGYRNFNPDKAGREVGHVGMMTSPDTIIHCVHGRGVVEESLQAFLAQNHFRGARRIISQNADLHVFIIPDGIEVETSLCLEAILFRSLPKS